MTTTQTPDTAQVVDEIMEIPLTLLEADPNQARKDMGLEVELRALGESLQAGQLQPIGVRPVAGGHYRVVFGERRFKAAQLVDMATIQAVIRDDTDNQARVAQLVENLERKDLTPLEEAEAIVAFMKATDMNQAMAARTLRRNPGQLSMVIRLPELPKQVLGWLNQGLMNRTHARHMLRLLDDLEAMKICLDWIKYDMEDDGVTSRELEAAVDDALAQVDGDRKRAKLEEERKAQETAKAKAKKAHEAEVAKAEKAGIKPPAAPKTPPVVRTPEQQKAQDKQTFAAAITRQRRLLIQERANTYLAQIREQIATMDVSHGGGVTDEMVRVFAGHTYQGPKYQGTSVHINEFGAFLLHQLPGNWPKGMTKDPASMIRLTLEARKDPEVQRSWLGFILWAELDSAKLDKQLQKDATAAVKAKRAAKGKGSTTTLVKKPSRQASPAEAVMAKCAKCDTEFALPTGPGRKPKRCPKCRGKAAA